MPKSLDQGLQGSRTMHLHGVSETANPTSTTALPSSSSSTRCQTLAASDLWNSRSFRIIPTIPYFPIESLTSKLEFCMMPRYPTPNLVDSGVNTIPPPDHMSNIVGNPHQPRSQAISPPQSWPSRTSSRRRPLQPRRGIAQDHNHTATLSPSYREPPSATGRRYPEMGDIVP